MRKMNSYRVLFSESYIVFADSSFKHISSVVPKILKTDQSNHMHAVPEQVKKAKESRYFPYVMIILSAVWKLNVANNTRMEDFILLDQSRTEH